MLGYPSISIIYEFQEIVTYWGVQWANSCGCNTVNWFWNLKTVVCILAWYLACKNVLIDGIVQCSTLESKIAINVQYMDCSAAWFEILAWFYSAEIGIPILLFIVSDPNILNSLHISWIIKYPTSDAKIKIPLLTPK